MDSWLQAESRRLSYSRPFSRSIRVIRGKPEAPFREDGCRDQWNLSIDMEVY